VTLGIRKRNGKNPVPLIRFPFSDADALTG
jgi:hypothetical protein